MANINLKRIMKRKGVGNKALAEKAGIPIGTLNKIIYGETTNPSLDTLTALSRALDCTLDELVEDMENPEHLTPSEEKLLDLFRQMNAEGQEKLIDNALDMVASKRYIKNNEFDMVGQKKA